MHFVRLFYSKLFCKMISRFPCCLKILLFCFFTGKNKCEKGFAKLFLSFEVSSSTLMPAVIFCASFFLKQFVFKFKSFFYSLSKLDQLHCLTRPAYPSRHKIPPGVSRFQLVFHPFRCHLSNLKRKKTIFTFWLPCSFCCVPQ